MTNILRPSLRFLPSSGVRELVGLNKYRGVLLDQFGVLHDGQVPYPGAIEAVHFLAESEISLLLLSNSSRRSTGALGKLAKMGFKEEWFKGVVTSGEITHHQLRHRPTPFWQHLGSKVLHFNWAERGAISLDGLGLDVVMQPENCDFILAHGTETLGDRHMSLDEFEAVLRRVAAESEQRGKAIPMIVANPDIVTVAGGGLAKMPGYLAAVYASLGGEVHLMGKPAPIIYEAACRDLGLSKEEVVAIGDSLEHDIAGAGTQSIASAFIVGGIHAQDVVDPISGRFEADDERMFERLGRLQREFGCDPDYVMPTLQL